ncbi:MAG: replication protein [Mesorhizobium sp.]|uniref:poly-gamma-glutamate hydrolase family protein n=1 Tax=Mesorhizobium sp. TaxID=1871066 RepID=UPI000FE92385|nr:poly-gamma-glutamate hydrolase family protein [Mesorhizobium sp.]RWP41759.1 MAG: replication protein [Mesorhizobium sp.]
MADRYRTFAELATNERFGIDYRIRVKDLGTPFVILAPHGGWIEPHTSEIAEAIAGTDLSFYAFEALKSGPHGDLHVTSHRFDEPKAINLVGRSRTAVAIHGRRNEGTEAVWLGGRATTLRDAIGACLRAAGFDAEPNTRLPGSDRANICNRTLSGEGAQLELPPSLRRRLASEAESLQAFCEAVRKALLSMAAT